MNTISTEISLSVAGLQQPPSFLHCLM